MDVMRRLLLTLLLLCPLSAFAQTTVTIPPITVPHGSTTVTIPPLTIPQDPAIPTLQQQLQTATQQIQTLQTQVKALTPVAAVTPTPVVSFPALDQFAAIMVDNTSNTATQQGTYGGGYWAAQIMAATDLYALATSDQIYYDSTRIFYQIADYTKDASWNAVAQKANASYLALAYANPATPAQLQAYHVFPKGLYLDWQRTANPKSKQAIIDMAWNASFQKACSGDLTPGACYPSAWVPGLGTIREMSYSMENRLYAKDADPANNYPYSFYEKQLRLYFAQALWMMQHQTATGMPASLTPDPLGPGDLYVRPFMIGIGAEAMIELWTRTQDPTILPLIQPVLDILWTQAYDGKGAMLYTVPQANGACPWTADTSDQCDTTKNPSQAVLNMLMAPAYAWVYAQTHDPVWRDRADTLFQGVVTSSYQTGALCCPAGKGFNQVMRWFPEYLKWRQ